MKNIIILCSLLLCFISCKKQEEVPTPAPITTSIPPTSSWNCLNSIGNSFNKSITCVYKNGANLFAGTYFSSGIYLSTDNGSSWTAVNNGIPVNIISNMTCFASSGTAIFAGASDGLYMSIDNGTNWTLSGMSGLTINTLAVSGTNLYAGTNVGFYLSTNSGNSWALASTGMTSPFVGVPPISSIAVIGTNIFASATGGGVFVSNNNATSWTSINTGLPASVINNVSAGAIKTIVSVGTSLFAISGDTSHVLYMSTNNGTSWIVVNTGLAGFKAIESDGLKLYGAINSSTNDRGIYVSSNNGGSWTLMNPGPISIDDLTVSGGNLYVHGFSQTCYTSL